MHHDGETICTQVWPSDSKADDNHISHLVHQAMHGTPQGALNTRIYTKNRHTLLGLRAHMFTECAKQPRSWHPLLARPLAVATYPHSWTTLLPLHQGSGAAIVPRDLPTVMQTAI